MESFAKDEIDEINMLKISEPMVDNRKVGESETDDNCQKNILVENHDKLPLDDTPFPFLKSLIPMMLTDGLEEGRKRNNKVIEFVHPKELKKRLDWLEISGEGTEDSKLLDACADIIKYSVKTGHPRFFNQLFGGMDEYSLAGSWLTEVLNTSQYTYEVAPVFTIMEKSIYKKLLSFVGFENGEGIFCPGGSVANIYALNIARYKRHPEIKTKGMTALEKPLVLLTSEKCHFSIKKAAILLGIGTDHVYTVKTDARGCMIPEELDKRIEEAYDSGLEPFFVNATAGTTVRGAYDPIDKIADVCKKHRLWLHVDGAWGGSALMSRTYRHYLKGIECADSMTWDPHKLMGAPLQCAVILTRHKDVLKQCNSACASYLFQQDKFYDVSYDTGDMSIQCSRKVDVLKLWMLWKAKGDTGFEKDIDNAFHCSRYLAQKLKRTPGFRLLDEPQCTNVCFWYIPPSLRDQPETEEWWQKLHRVAPAIKKRMMENGSMMIGYQPDGKYVNFFRMIVTNLDSTEEDMDFVVDEITRLGKDL